MPKQRGPASSPLFMLVASVTFIGALYFAKAILLPLGIAILLVFLLSPVANRLERWGLPRIPATLVVVSLVFSGLGVLGYVVTMQVMDLRYQMGDYRQNVKDKVHAVLPSEKLKEFFAGVSKFGDELIEPEKESTVAVEDNAPSPAADEAAAELGGKTGEPEKQVEVQVVEKQESLLTHALEWLGSILAPFGTAGLVLVLVFFIMLDRENQRNRLLQLFGTSNLHATTEALHDASHRIGRYLRMQFLVNACYGLVVGVGLALIGVPVAVLWGVMAFALRFLPYVGPWIAALAPILVSLGHSEGWTQPLLVMGWFIGIEILCNNAVEPWVYGNTTGVSVVGVILSALFWTWLWGPIGLIIALPITVCLVVAARYVPQLRFLTVLFADQPPMTPSEQVYQRLLAFDYHEPVRLARKHLKESSLATFYDQVLIPALVLAEHDRHADLLNDEQEAFVAEAVEDLVEELADHSSTRRDEPDAAQSAPAHDSEPLSARVLCVPLRDHADEAAARMLAQLLATEGLEVETGGADSLTGEVVDRVARDDIDVVVISVLPPISARDSRLLWRRLRSRYPDLPIIVGFWHGQTTHEYIEPPENDMSSKVVSTLADAVAQVRSIAVQQQLVAKTDSRATGIVPA